MSRPNDQLAVTRESGHFAGTCGESATARKQQFLPAFRNTADGRVELARLPNGAAAPMHLIAYLPTEWASRRDEQGLVLALIDSIVAGFVRNGEFYTREEAAAAG